ncbi:FAD-dependent monooxygenase [Rhizobium sp. ZK1]|uniref:FAD-dependent monooxygenase n=1 Tax=Rhizobium sp. ZK1 TaxID=3389872 RepID=UPI0039F671E3
MKIIIAGAGIAGLAAAKAMEIKGHQCEIYEQARGPRLTGAGIFLLGNATRALNRLVELEPIEGLGRLVREQRIFSSDGKLIHAMSADDFWKDCGPCLAMPRSVLIQSLLSCLKHTKITYGKAVVDFHRTPTGVLALMSDGSSAEGDLVVAADGVNSWLRRITNGCRPRSLGISCWRTVTENVADISAWTAMLGRGRTLLAIPITADKAYLYADCRTSEVKNGAAQGLKHMFQDFGPPLGHLVAQLDRSAEIHFGALEEVPNFSNFEDGLVFIGDAAHACSPSMAQGAGMALEDALVLAEIVSDTSSREPILRRFSQQRQQRVAWVRRQARARDMLRGLSPIVRDFTLKHLGDRLYNRSYRLLKGNLMDKIF